MAQTRDALKHLLRITEQQLSQTELLLTTPLSEDDTSRAVYKAAELHLRVIELKGVLSEAT